MTNPLVDTITFDRPKPLAIRFVLPEELNGKHNYDKKEAALALAEFILENGLMYHETQPSRFKDHVEEKFWLMVCKPKRDLP